MFDEFRKLLIALPMICCMSVSASDSIIISSQINIYPYFFDSGQGADGILPDVLNNILGNVYGLGFNTEVSGEKESNADVIFLPSDEPMPSGYVKHEVPLQISYVICFRRNEPVESIYGLTDKKVIVVKNDYPFSALYRHRTSYILNVSSPDDALRILSEGYNDCAILPLSAVSYIKSQKKFSNIDYLPTPYIVKPLALAVRQNDRRLDSTIEVTLKESFENGKFEAISSQWIHYRANVQYVVSGWIYAAIILLLVVIFVLCLWIKTLYGEVKDSSSEQIRGMIHNPTSPLVFPANSDLLQKIMLNAPFWFVISNQDGHVVKASRAFLRSVAQIDNIPDNCKWNDLVDVDTAEQLIDFDNVIYSGQANSIIRTVMFKSAFFEGDRWIVKHPFKYEDRSEIYILSAIISPIFDTNMFYNHLTTESFIQAIIDTSQDLIYFKSVDGTYLQANKSFYDYYQMTEQQVVGHSDMELFGSKLSDCYLESDKIVLQSGKSWSEQSWHTDAQCIDHKFENRKMPLINTENHIFGLVGISRDISDIDRYSKQVKALNDKMVESERMKTSFLANLGHDIRTPMKSITHFCDMLADIDLTYDQRIEITENIQTNGDILTDLVNDMVDYSKIEAGNVQIKYSDFNLNSIIADVYNIANAKKMQLNKDNMYISLLIDTIEDDVMIRSDSFRLKQILKNMLTTIIRFADTECIYFGYRTTSDKVFFFVNADRGEESKDELEQYAQEHENYSISLSQIEESYGISIIIAQSIIEKMGGKLWVDNINSGHPNFMFYIPYVHEKDLSSVMYDSKNVEFEIPDWTGHTILIAEDEELNFILLQGLMLRTKVKVIRAKNGVEAVEQYKSNPDIEVVLMDVRMPEMNGLEASELILKYDSKADIIAQTAYAIPEVSERCERIGIHKLLEKPIDQGELFAECNKYMKRKQTANDNELMD